MSQLIFSFLMSTTAHAYESGNAPFCKMDNYGNLQCYYYSLSDCRAAARNEPDSACIKK